MTSGWRTPDENEVVIIETRSSRVLMTSGDAFEFHAEVAQGGLDRLYRVGEVEDDARADTAAWIESLMCMVGVIIADHEGPTYGSLTRRHLLRSLIALLRRVERDGTTEVPAWLDEQLHEIERSRLLNEKFGERWWAPARHASPGAVLKIYAERDHRLAESRHDPKVLAALLRDVISALRSAPERSREIAARAGRRQLDLTTAASNVWAFWTKRLGRPPQVSKGMVAFADVAFWLCGLERSESAIREALERERPGMSE